VIRLNPDATFTAEVTIPVTGKDEPVKVEFEFRAVSRKRIQSLMILARLTPAWRGKRMFEYLRLCWRAKRFATVVDMLDEFVVGWKEIEPAYSREVLAALIQEYPGSHTSITLRFLSAWYEERIKN
jgi:hypothetical protein